MFSLQKQYLTATPNKLVWYEHVTGCTNLSCITTKNLLLHKLTCTPTKYNSNFKCVINVEFMT